MKSHKPWLLAAGTAMFVAFFIATIVLAVELAIALDKLEAKDRNDQRLSPMRSSDSPMGRFTKFAVAADNGICSAAGRSILLAGGNAVDAAIAAELCIGIMDAHSSGLGGGLFITVYNKTTGICTTIDGRETAPAAANKSMFSNTTQDSTIGWRSIAVPGDLHGLYTAHKNFGRLSWSTVLQPAIDLAEKHPVSMPLSMAIQSSANNIRNASSLIEILLNNATGDLFTAGEFMQRRELRDTLIRLASASDPIDEFYGTGETARNVIKEFQENDAIITADDFRNYSSIVQPGLLMSLPKLGLNVCSPPPPSGGAVTLAILNILSGYDLQPDDFQLTERASLTYHRILEAMKFAYAARSQLADPAFDQNSTKVAENITSSAWAEDVRKRITGISHPLDYYGSKYQQPVDSGTTHISAIDGDGNACAITSTIVLHFGSKQRSQSTGIIWNDGMDGFSQPDRPNYFGYAPSEANYIQPGKRPLSSMSPLVFFDNRTGDVRLAIGAAGGSEIISSTSYVSNDVGIFMLITAEDAHTAARILWAGENVKQAVDAARLHNQLIPNTTSYGPDFPEVVVRDLERRGQLMELGSDVGSVVCAVETVFDEHGKGVIQAESDFRKAGGFPQGSDLLNFVQR